MAPVKTSFYVPVLTTITVHEPGFRVGHSSRLVVLGRRNEVWRMATAILLGWDANSMSHRGGKEFAAQSPRQVRCARIRPPPLPRDSKKGAGLACERNAAQQCNSPWIDCGHSLSTTGSICSSSKKAPSMVAEVRRRHLSESRAGHTTPPCFPMAR